MSAPKPIGIDPLSVVSLLVQTLSGDRYTGVATGFVVRRGSSQYLITNWHVLSGRDPDTNRPTDPSGQVPDTIRVPHHVAGQLGSWATRDERLYGDDGEPRWLEHPRGREVDVVALELRSLDSAVTTYPMDLALAESDVAALPGMPVSIIGFPFGLRIAGALPVWKTGHIASDPDVDFQGRHAFLIDATTREGMSGSPVVIRGLGSYLMKGGGMALASSATRFLGVYSAQVVEMELGLVWRPSSISEIIAGAAGT